MNDRGILTTWREIEEREGFAYFYPDHEEVADVKLEFRTWGKSRCLGYYFSYLEDNTGLLLNAWVKEVRNKTVYCPQKCNIDFSNVQDGTLWRVTIKQNSRGNYTWVDAEPLND